MEITKNSTVASLRRNNFKVRVTHLRVNRADPSRLYLKREIEDFKNIGSNGGLTKVDITFPDGQITVSSEAKCNVTDSFNRRVGFLICLGRIIKQMEFRKFIGAYEIGVDKAKDLSAETEVPNKESKVWKYEDNKFSVS